MKYYHDQHIGVYENAFSDEWCDKVINYFKFNPDEFASRNRGDIVDTHGHLWDEDLRNGFINFFTSCFNLYTQKYPHTPQPLDIVGWKIQKTLPTEGYHPYHIEHGINFNSILRIGVWTVYLNDVEEGGETEFLHQLKRIKPKKGTLCIFPASYTHVHRGNTPFTGEKYIMTGWLDAILPKQEEVGS
jgi:hypothetical protein